MHRKITQLVLLIFLMGWFACCSGPDPDQPFQTRILEVRVQPNPVAVGDTATFACIIEDSLDKRFQYSWFLEADGILLDTVTIDNTIKWRALDSIGVYNHAVEAFNNSPDSISPNRSFSIEVVK